MTTDDPTAFPVGDDGVFEMDPQAVMLELARTLITGHEQLIKSQRTSTDSAQLASAPEYAAFLETAQRYEHSWTTETLPHILAGMRLAIEVYDTYGPGRSRIDDPIDAAVFNNKYFVWVKELGGA